VKKRRTPAKKGATVQILWREEESTEETSARLQTGEIRGLGNPVDVPLAFIADLPEELIQLSEFPIQAEGTGVGFYTHVDDGFKFVVRSMTPRQRKLLYG